MPLQFSIRITGSSHQPSRSPRELLARSSMRRIRRVGRIHVHMQLLRGGDFGSVTLSIAAVVRAVSGDVFALRRLRELPNFGEPDAALRGAWRVLGKCAAGRGWASVIDQPISNLSICSVLPNVFRSDHIVVVFVGDSGTINAGAKSSSGNAIDPRIDVRPLLGQHTPALLLIEEDDRRRGKAFPARCGGGRSPIRLAQLAGVGSGL